MGLFTLYNVVSPVPAAESQGLLAGLLGPLGFEATETYERDDGSQLVLLRHEREATQLGVAVVPLAEGGAPRFQPAAFDERGSQDAAWAASIRTVFKVGAQEGPDPSVAVRQGLALAAGLAGGGRIYDLTAFLALEPDQAREQAASPFDIRRHVTYHYLTPPSGEPEHSWLHLHGMAKFFRPDPEAFDIRPDLSHKALALLLHLASELAQGTVIPAGEPIPYGHGAFRVTAGAEARPALTRFPAEALEAEHPGPTLVVDDAGVYRSLDMLLRGAYELEPKTRDECAAEQRVWQERLEAIRAAWAERQGQLVVRAGLTVGPQRAVEHIWIAIDQWTGAVVSGRLLNDAFGDPGLLRGSTVAFDQGLISGVSVMQGDQALDEVESLRAIDPAAAARLDEALATGGERARVEESRSPDGAAIARLVDDGHVGALVVLHASTGALRMEPLWLFNRGATPPVVDPRRPAQGRPPLLSEVYTSQRSPEEAPPPAAAAAFSWEGDRVALSLDGELWAVADLAEGCGWSKLIDLASRHGRPLRELSRRRPALRRRGG